MGNNTPWGAIVQGALGLGQLISGGIQQRKATKKYEKTLSENPIYKQNQSILDYYNTALQRYGVSPTDSAMYKRNMQNIDRGVATGINALQDRRSGTAGASSILRAANDARLNTEVAAENRRDTAFGQLGSATVMKAGEDKTAFDINEFQPWQNKLALYGAKATGGTNIMNAGVGSMNNALNNYYQMQALKDMYGDSTSGRRSGGRRGSGDSTGG